MQDDAGPKKRTNPLLLILLAVVPAAVVGAVMYILLVRNPSMANRELNATLTKHAVGLSDASPGRLDARFIDSDGDLVADAPSDAKSFIDPPTLYFSYVASEEPTNYPTTFKEFMAHLSKETGKPVEYAPFKTAEDEIAAMRDGKLHIAGLNTGVVPMAVNQAGFVPVCNFGAEEGGSTYQMELIVPADSQITDLQGLAGHELVLTVPGSNSGFKAPLVLLSRDNDLQPGRDFTIRYSGSHDASIAGIASKQYEAAAVAGDVLTRTVTAGNIKKEQYRTIYKSENFPTAGLGYVYNLKPELADKIKKGFFSFQWKGTGVEKEFGASKETKFVPVSFKNDWSLVRRIDDAIRNVQTQVETPEEPTTQPTTSATAQ